MSMLHADHTPFSGNGTLLHTLVTCASEQVIITLGQPVHLQCHSNWDLRAQTS